MKTKWLSSPGSGNKAGGSLFQRMWVMAILVALLAAFLPESGVFAAPAGDELNGDTLGQEWKNKLSMVHAENLFYAQVKLFPADYQKAEDMARPYELLGKYGSALKQANEIITKHVGFDEKGEVSDTEDAWQSVHDLAECLRIMRGMLEKLDEEGYPIRRVK